LSSGDRVIKPRSRPNRPTRRHAAAPSDAERLLGVEGATVVDILDRLLTKGVMATGDLTLGVAGVDLVYIRLSALLSAVDRILKPQGAHRSSARRLTSAGGGRGTARGARGRKKQR
jgi:hypothetical protein